MKSILTIVFSLLLFLNGKAQEQNVAYKSKVYSYKYSKNISVKTNCEMAELVFTKGSGNTIEIKCTYSAKHADKSIAAHELERHNILVRKTFNEIYISNYFTLNGDEKEPKAKLKIKFEISVPDKFSVELHNNFGSITATNIECNGTIYQDFGKVEFNNCSGNLKIVSNLTAINTDNFSGKMEIRNKSGDVQIKNAKGNNALLFIENSNANIMLQKIASSVNVKMHLTNCSVNIEKANLENHAVNIESIKQPIIADSKYKIEIKNNKYTLVLNQDRAMPGFIIHSTLSSIKIN